MTTLMEAILKENIKKPISFRHAIVTEEYLDEYLKIPEVAEEGIVKAAVLGVKDELVGAGSEIKGWFESIKTKQEHINKIADKLIHWLEDKKYNEDIDLEMGRIKTWLKTSDWFHWRFYFILNDQIYNEMVKAIKNEELSIIEDLIDLDMIERRKVTRYLESAKKIDDLIITVEKYRARVNNIFDLILKRKLKTKGFPFQVLLLGMVDLNITIRNIVNLYGVI